MECLLRGAFPAFPIYLQNGTIWSELTGTNIILPILYPLPQAQPERHVLLACFILSPRAQPERLVLLTCFILSPRAQPQRHVLLTCFMVADKVKEGRDLAGDMF